MKKITLLFSAFALMIASSFGQNELEKTEAPQQRICGAMNGVSQADLDNMEEFLAPRVAAYIQAQANGGSPEAVYNIPVIVHIIHNSTEAVGVGRNVSNARVQQQIQRLNDDFRLLNGDASNASAAFQLVQADCEVNFCLITTYPSGHPQAGNPLSEVGVNRVSAPSIGLANTTTGYSQAQVNGTMKPATSFNPNEVMNFWCCQLSSGLLGFAQFPNTGAANTDGVVSTYTAFGNTSGPYNLGRTATHEVGHYLNLRHIWGDDGGACTGSDQVNDTPNQANNTFGCPSGVQTDACVGAPNGYMYQNYMDYTDDACMVMFTAGQKARVQAILNPSTGANRRRTLNAASLTLCAPPASNPDDAGISLITTPDGTYCSSTITPVVDLRNYGTNAITSVTINYMVDGSPQTPFAWTGNLASGATTSVNLPNITASAGAHTFDANTSSPNGNVDTAPGNDAATQTNFTVSSGVSLPLTENFETFALCGTTNNCETEVCAMINGWVNETNLVVDDIDWRTDEGGTPSTGTGPTTDFNPGTATGNYLYLEASGAPVCSNKQANLISPCIDLTSASSAALTFAYHMNGISIGSLHVDINVNGTWTNDITPAINGSQGNAWVQRNEPLTPYLGNIVQFRFRGITGGNWESDIAIDDISVTGSVGINNAALANSFNIHPNPSNGVFNFEYSGNSKLSAKVVDINARVINQLELSPMETGKIDLSDYANGLYMIVLTNGENVVTKRIVLSK